MACIFNFQTTYSCALCQLHALRLMSCKSNVGKCFIKNINSPLFLRLYCFIIEIERMLVAKLPRGIIVITTVFKKNQNNKIIITFFLNAIRYFQNSF